MNKQRLFVASCISLLTTSMVFAIRGYIEADYKKTVLVQAEDQAAAGRSELRRST